MLSPENTKPDAITAVQTMTSIFGLSIIDQDLEKPWGAYFVVDPKQTASFVTKFFSEEPKLQAERDDLYPKFLLVKPGEQLSWQYHQRREEIWKVVNGPIGVALNETDEMGEIQKVEQGKLITVSKETRHRIVGLDNWGLIAEVWHHTDPANPSDEQDIIRLLDDYGRD